MAVLHLLGTGSAGGSADRTTTMLALENEGGVVLVDCGGDAVHRLLAAGIDLARLLALVVTHEHADHVGGFPLLMEKLWLHGRREPLDVYGIAPAVSQARRIHDAFDTSEWPGYPGVRYHEVAHAENALVFESDAWRVTASPGVHAVPTVATRFEDRRGRGALAYSCDTEYAPEVVRLAKGVDLLVHEATGGGPFHASAADAARVAREAGVDRCVLVHLPDRDVAGEVDEARRVFEGLIVGVDGARFEF